MTFFTSELSNEPLLPFDGEIFYHGILLEKFESNYFLKELFEKIKWSIEKKMTFENEIITMHKIAWYGSKDFSYTNSLGIIKIAEPWIEELLAIKQVIELYTNSMYNSCFLQLYSSNDYDFMEHYCNLENDLTENSSIACISIGTACYIDFEHKKGTIKKGFEIQNGELLEIKENTQKNWLYRMSPTRKLAEVGICLTFRQIKI